MPSARLRSLRSTEPRNAGSLRAATAKLRFGVETKQRVRVANAAARRCSTAAASVERVERQAEEADDVAVEASAARDGAGVPGVRPSGSSAGVSAVRRSRLVLIQSSLAASHEAARRSASWPARRPGYREQLARRYDAGVQSAATPPARRRGHGAERTTATTQSGARPPPAQRRGREQQSKAPAIRSSAASGGTHRSSAIANRSSRLAAPALRKAGAALQSAITERWPCSQRVRCDAAAVRVASETRCDRALGAEQRAPRRRPRDRGRAACPRRGGRSRAARSQMTPRERHAGAHQLAGQPQREAAERPHLVLNDPGELGDARAQSGARPERASGRAPAPAG